MISISLGNKFLLMVFWELSWVGGLEVYLYSSCLGDHVHHDCLPF